MSEEFARRLIEELTRRIQSMPRLNAAGRINQTRDALVAYRNSIKKVMKDMGYKLD